MDFYRGTASGDEGATPYAPGIPGATYLDAGAANGTPYWYTVTAVNAAGESAQSAEATATPSLPPLAAAPTGVAAAAADEGVYLTWNYAPGADSYNVYYSLTSGGPYTLLNTAATVTNNSYSATGLTNGTPYFFVVTSVNAGGESGYGTETNATPLADLTPPPPGGITTDPGNSQVTVSWSAVPGATSYNVYRSTSPDGAGAVEVGSGIVGTSFTDTNVTTGGTYYYSVTAVNSSGESNQNWAGAANANVVDTPFTPAIAGPSDRVTGKTADFTVSVPTSSTTGGTPPFTYEWRSNGPNAVGGMDSTSATAHATFHEAGTYKIAVGVTDATGAVEWSSFPVTVSATPTAPLVMLPAGPVTVPAGGSQVVRGLVEDQFGNVITQSTQLALQSGSGATLSGGTYTAPTPSATTVTIAGSPSSGTVTRGQTALYVSFAIPAGSWTSATLTGTDADTSITQVWAYTPSNPIWSADCGVDGSGNFSATFVDYGVADVNTYAGGTLTVGLSATSWQPTDTLTNLQLTLTGTSAGTSSESDTITATYTIPGGGALTGSTQINVGSSTGGGWVPVLTDAAGKYAPWDGGQYYILTDESTWWATPYGTSTVNFTDTYPAIDGIDCSWDGIDDLQGPSGSWSGTIVQPLDATVGASNGAANGSGTLDVSSTANYYVAWRWQDVNGNILPSPPAGAPSPPGKLYAALASTVGASVSYTSYDPTVTSGLSATASASDQYGESPTPNPLSPPFVATVNPSDPESSYGSTSAGGVHIEQAPVTFQTALHAQASNSVLFNNGQSGAQATADAYGSGYVQPLASPVVIACPSSKSVFPVGTIINVQAAAPATIASFGTYPGIALTSIDIKVNGTTIGSVSAPGPYAVPWTATEGACSFSATAHYADADGQTATFDSASLTAYAATLAVPNVNGWGPSKPLAGGYIYAPLAATLSSGLDSDGSGATFATYSWSVVNVWMSPNSAATNSDGSMMYPFTQYVGDVSNVGFSEAASSIGSGTDNVNFDALFADAGQYLVEVQCVATIFDSSTGVPLGTIAGTGYIGAGSSDVPAVRSGVLHGNDDPIIVVGDINVFDYDRKVEVIPYYPATLFTDELDLRPIYIQIPPVQPVTKHGYVPAPNMVENAAQAVSHPLNFDYIAGLCKDHTIGDWGKEPAWYPDIDTENTWPRRFGANFNFGAMCAAAKWPMWMVLTGAQLVNLMGDTHSLHYPDEQEAIMAGWNWYNTKYPKMPYGSILKVPIIDDGGLSYPE